jgi:outer membrane murein-binding lipoprotein Lpp
LKRALTLLAVVLALTLAVSTSSAGAANPQGKQIKKLQTQVKILKKQVKTLQKQIKAIDNALGASFAATACSLAMTADLFQATWQVIDNNHPDAISSTLLSPALNDYSACTYLGLTRASELSLSPYTSLLGLLGGG